MFAFTVNADGERLELAYWRKHNRLHGWMENLYHEKGGTEEFNCVEVELDESDIDRLEKAVKNKGLPATQGFFFGSDSYDWREDESDTLEFIDKAKIVLEGGGKVFYDS